MYLRNALSKLVSASFWRAIPAVGGVAMLRSSLFPACVPQQVGRARPLSGLPFGFAAPAAPAQRLSVLPFLLLLLSPLWGQQDLSLEEAITIGLANNYQIQVARAAAAAADNNNDWSLAGKYPTVNLDLNSTNTYSGTNNPASVVTESNIFSNGLAPGVGVSWILFDGYRVDYTKNQLAATARLSNEQVRVQVQNSIQAIIQAYYGAVVQRDQLVVLEQVLELSRDRIRYQQARQEFGQANTFDLLQVQDAYLNDSTTYLVQRNTYENALRNLQLAMGVQTPTTYRLTNSLEQLRTDYDQAALEAKLQQDNPELVAQSVNIELANINTQLQQTARYPRISLNAGASYNWNMNNGSQTFNFGGNENIQDLPGIAATTIRGFVNVAATYTLWDGGARSRRIETAELQQVQAQMQYSALEQQLRTQLANTLATYRNQRELVTITTQLVENAQRNLTIAEERFRGGLINSFDYRTIQLGYINATQSRLNALLNLKNTETELQRLTGGLLR
jgi:outer membrane protein